jgi:hypothetical protein
VKFTHACILAVATAATVLPTTALALGSTPAFQVRSTAGKAATSARSTPRSTSQLNQYQRENLSRLSGSRTHLVLAGSPDTLRVAVFQVQFTDSLMGGQPGSNRKAVWCRVM